jgi:hypothetical protein
MKPMKHRFLTGEKTKQTGDGRGKGVLGAAIYRLILANSGQKSFWLPAISYPSQKHFKLCKFNRLRMFD